MENSPHSSLQTPFKIKNQPCKADFLRFEACFEAWLIVSFSQIISNKKGASHEK
jgi:hypothetical protein